MRLRLVTFTAIAALFFGVKSQAGIHNPSDMNGQPVAAWPELVSRAAEGVTWTALTVLLMVCLVVITREVRRVPSVVTAPAPARPAESILLTSVTAVAS